MSYNVKYDPYDDISSEEDLPESIDRKSYMEHKRMNKEKELKEYREELTTIDKIENPSEEIKERIQFLQKMLKKNYKETECTQINSDYNYKNSENEDLEEIFLQKFFCDSSAKNFLKLVGDKRYNLEKIRETVLYNLCSYIKEGDDETAMLFSKVAFFFSSYIDFGVTGDLLYKMDNEKILKDQYKKEKEEIEKLKKGSDK